MEASTKLIGQRSDDVDAMANQVSKDPTEAKVADCSDSVFSDIAPMPGVTGPGDGFLFA